MHCGIDKNYSSIITSSESNRDYLTKHVNQGWGTTKIIIDKMGWGGCQGILLPRPSPDSLKLPPSGTPDVLTIVFISNRASVPYDRG